ncbi:hypothetical protein BDW02DRAFT_119355 [Decorospora gaudefroyi]|uniref:Uncharacterized protein n=1 Tax=Decorospora gaudefroyi TaxID=184978 RepID=A0A6A5KN48_9PLEO|nr:hypothetical protein BDW02DRAFT_119355 [Decorospora gaudefroyi]
MFVLLDSQRLWRPTSTKVADTACLIPVELILASFEVVRGCRHLKIPILGHGIHQRAGRTLCLSAPRSHHSCIGIFSWQACDASWVCLLCLPLDIGADIPNRLLRSLGEAILVVGESTTRRAHLHPISSLRWYGELRMVRPWCPLVRRTKTCHTAPFKVRVARYHGLGRPFALLSPFVGGDLRQQYSDGWAATESFEQGRQLHGVVVALRCSCSSMHFATQSVTVRQVVYSSSHDFQFVPSRLE